MMEEYDIKMWSCSERLKTLKYWPFAKDKEANCTARKIAEAGFYCPRPRKEPDFVRCFLCQKELDGWEPEDSPLDEHKSHSPECQFLKLGCKDMKDLTINESVDVIILQTAIQLNAVGDKHLKEYESRIAATGKKLRSFLDDTAARIATV